MTRHAAVGVDDDLSSGEAGVAHWTADFELSGRVDEQAVVTAIDVERFQNRIHYCLLYTSDAADD